jgi:intein/homing endonuclease
MSLAALQDYTFTAKYARWIPEKKRRETWLEAVERVENMHLTKFPQAAEEIKWAFDRVREKKVLGAQRVLQFGGEPILRKNSRAFNCLGSYCDRLRFFQETYWLLLCGGGVGFSVQKHHVAKLPSFSTTPRTEKRTFVIPDSIEGWADSLGVLLATYFPSEEFPDWEGVIVEFDYSVIRPEGSPLASCVGKAPGPKPLRVALEAVRRLLDRVQSEGKTRLRPIDAYDLVMHIANSVISGGVRRSATICLFSPDDEEMVKAKTGNWFIENPQRGRSNNSAVLDRATTTREEFHNLMTSVKEFGEPGFLWTDSKELVVNPCFHPDVRILTEFGYKKIGDLYKSDQPISVGSDSRIRAEDGVEEDEFGVTTRAASPVRLTQREAEVFELETTHGHTIKATANHKFPTTTGRKRLDELRIGDTLFVQSGQGEFGEDGSYEQGLLLGWMTGDGSTQKDGTAYFELYGEEVELKDYFGQVIHGELQASGVTRSLSWGKKTSTVDSVRMGGLHLGRYIKEVCDLKTVEELKQEVPEFIWGASIDCVRGYIQGLFATDGSVQFTSRGKKSTLSVRLTQSNRKLLSDVQVLLAQFGISSSIYPRRKEGNYFLPDGKGGVKEYHCKQVFELIINRPNCVTLEDTVGLFGKQGEYLTRLLDARGRDCRKPERFFTQVKSIQSVGFSDVYCLTEPETNSVIANGVVAGNCVEIGFWPVDEETGKSGFQGCNLSDINGSKIKTLDDFLEAAEAAAIIGTLQAGYTDLGYLGEVSERIFRREALLGVSITGIMDSPEICLNPEFQRLAAERAVEANKRVAAKIGIRPAARVTCVKPAGSTSCVLGTASGIHPHHARRYIRRVQANHLETPLEMYEKKNPRAVEVSVWNPNGTDKVIAFPIEVPEEAVVKNDLGAVDFLKQVQSTQRNWVLAGNVVENATQSWLSNNVSNTVVVKLEEWDAVEDYLYENRADFAGVSLLPGSGDLDYDQAPMVAVKTPAEVAETYGDGSLMASGLIVDGLRAFDDNLWVACNAVLGLGDGTDSDAKRDWVRRAVQFADRYFDGDRRKMTFCLKDVHNWKLWCDLRREYRPVDYTEMVEVVDGTANVEAESACAGGGCEVQLPGR